MTKCDVCQVADFIDFEARFFSDPGTVEKILSMARRWHRKCLNWRGRNTKGCDCDHVVLLQPRRIEER